MRVPYDVVRDGLSAINEAAAQMAAAQRQVSTGRRITRAGDDPAASQMAVAEHAAIASADIYSRTGDAAANRLAAADSMLSAFGDKLAAVIVAAMSAQGSSTTAASRSAAADAVTGLRDSLLSDINTAMLDIARDMGCTHFLFMDCDEYWHDFAAAKQQYIQSGAEGSSRVGQHEAARDVDGEDAPV